MEVLISTRNLTKEQEHQNLLKKMNVKTPSIVINQVTEEMFFDTEKEENRIYTYQEKGLSKSRNRGIKLLKEEIGLFADDDLQYVDDYEQIIRKAYEQNPKADIIAFYVETLGGKRPIKRRKSHWVNFINCMQIFSFQISFRKEKIKDVINFDETFGAGSDYSHGEEAIFLEDALKKNLKIYYCNEKIATVEHKNTTWFKGYNEHYLEEQGAIFYRMSKRWYWLFLVQFAIRKSKIFQRIKLVTRIKLMIKGANEYRNSTL